MNARLADAQLRSVPPKRLTDVLAEVVAFVRKVVIEPYSGQAILRHVAIAKLTGLERPG